MAAVNYLAGENVNQYFGAQSAGRGQSSTSAAMQADGTQYVVGAIVLGAVLFLVLLELGGFKTIIAAGVTR